VDEQWTLSELVNEAATRIAALPAPKNGQVRAVPDDRTIRYYGTIGLLDRPVAMRGRTALYGRRHLAQIIAIKRLQTTGRSLAEIQELWSTLDDVSLARMSGVTLPEQSRAASRREFWKREAVAPEPTPQPARVIVSHDPQPTPELELRIQLAPHITLSLAVAENGISLTPAEVSALRAAAAPLVELARRQLALHPEGEDHV
jgi:DNA-binding transcriptional MerR regulator